MRSNQILEPFPIPSEKRKKKPSSASRPQWHPPQRLPFPCGLFHRTSRTPRRTTSHTISASMALRHGMKQQHLFESFLNLSFMQERYYASKINWKELRPMILKRARNRATDYPIRRMVPVAEEVLIARETLIRGVSALLQVVAVKSCEFCPEVYVGQTGHFMKTCPGFKQLAKNQPHKWTNAQLNDILVPVETYHLTEPFEPEAINHNQRFDFTRIPAVLELCYQAGADLPQNALDMHDSHLANQENHCKSIPPSLSMPGMNITYQQYLCHQANTDLPEDIENQNRRISSIANLTLEAWERLRFGVKKLLLVYNAKVCQHCSEVHVGPTGHKVRTCGMYKYEAWRGAHMWKRAEVDDIVPEKIVWHRRPHDPIVLEDSGRGFYGHAPSVVDICAQAGARVPEKYFCMMKVHGLAPKM